ncbi:MAG TPA: hypothetical protein VNK04_16975 [Gemmataceae bacterium]|nr:hypothetical protein [Gemmataceae bacterium]
MLTLVKRLGVTVLAAVGVLAVGVPPADAQVQSNAPGAVNPFFRIPSNMPLAAPPAPTPFVTPPFPTATLSSFGYIGGLGGATLYSNPYAASPGYVPGYYTNPYFPWGYPYYMNDPFSGYLTGAAQVISAQAQFMSTRAQTDLLREQYRQMRIDTHRRILEEWQYERNLLANVPDPRDIERKFATHRALNDPPLTEILSGESLNRILVNIQELERKGATGPTMPLDEDLLKQINVTNGERGNIGLLRTSGGRLSWPLPLQGPTFDEERKRLDQFAPEAVKQVEFNGQVNPKILEQMRADVNALGRKLNENIRELTPTQYVEARRYLSQLEDALTALEQPGVQNYFSGKWGARGKTVGELVKNMAGLRFAPATQGTEAAYRALHQALTAYNMALEQQVAQK